MKPYTFTSIVLVALLAAACSGSPTAPEPFNYIPPDQRWKPVDPASIVETPTQAVPPPVINYPYPPSTPPPPPPPVAPPAYWSLPGLTPVPPPVPWTPPSYTPGPNPTPVPSGPSPTPCAPAALVWGPWTPWLGIQASSPAPGSNCQVTVFRRWRDQACSGRREVEEKTECVIP